MLILYVVNDSKSIYVSLENTDECLYLNMDMDVSLVGKSTPEKKQGHTIGKVRKPHSLSIIVSHVL